MTKIFLFNPDNDLALAHGGGHYVAPPFAQDMQRDLAMLPLWYAPEGALILVADDDMKAKVDNSSKCYGLNVKGITLKNLPAISDCEFWPWGWSINVRNRLKHLCATAPYFPSNEALEQLRMLSHRRTSIAVHQLLREQLPHLTVPAPVECCTWEEVSRFIERNPHCYIKMPWSGSGQGIYHYMWHKSSTDHKTAHQATGEKSIANNFQQWCQGAIKRQGSVLCEVGLERTLDFAMEFCCTQGEVKMVGYSVFESDRHNQYSGGVVASQATLRRLITKQYPQINAIENAITRVVATLFAPHYNGFLGIDMLLYRDCGQIKINPCVEVNLRATMGLVLVKLGEMLPNDGRFCIAEKDVLFQTMKEKDCTILTPLRDNTRYVAFVVNDD